jgi:regulator of RNase E activity RraA
MRFHVVDQPVSIGGIAVASGDLIHANSEGVIRIPQSCLPELAPAAIRMRAFEHDAHTLMRRTDVTPAYKQHALGDLPSKYGFGKKNPSFSHNEL